MKPRLAFIDHSFHKKTRSTYFLRDVLAKDFELLNIWDESWQHNKGISAEEINRIDCEYVLFFQILPTINELKKINHKIIWAPMYDPCFLYGNAIWLELSALPIKIISFSKSLSKKLKKYKLDVLEVQYYFNPSDFKFKKLKNNNSSISIFFWQRGSVKFKKIKKLLTGLKINQMTIKNSPDPGFGELQLSKEEIRRYNITIVKGHVSKEEYLKMVEGSDVFIAPRSLEGIGMSFLEPMAMGKVVIAMNHPTMNEYIKSGFNGFLYNPLFPKKIRMDDLVKIGSEARKTTEKGYADWTRNSAEIASFIQSKYQSRDLGEYRLFIRKFLDKPYVFIKTVYIEFVTRF